MTDYELVKDVSDKFAEKATLWKLPFYIPWFNIVVGSQGTTNHIVVSEVLIPELNRRELYAFPADKNGDVLAWGELEGSMHIDPFNVNYPHEDVVKAVIEHYKESENDN